jgi:hypothetical protein
VKPLTRRHALCGGIAAFLAGIITRGTVTLVNATSAHNAVAYAPEGWVMDAEGIHLPHLVGGADSDAVVSYAGEAWYTQDEVNFVLATIRGDLLAALDARIAMDAVDPVIVDGTTQPLYSQDDLDAMVATIRHEVTGVVLTA